MKKNRIDNCAAPKFADAQSTSGNDAVVTIAAIADEFHVIDWIAFSYSAAGAGRIRVAIGGTTVLDLDVPAAGPHQLDFSQAPLYDAAETKNQAVVITLTGITSQIGKLAVRYR